ncbi:hypothetical protein M8C21_023532 [Ambrosia artemisiifolia]|uniref:Uncharacterized protein n=1 Tax=Ambrosia artemisiifolia TaxID=4212 RepID=A0AAD5CHP5_AMBAR|nr:hypothetical protein M8C21_023532 [Ambrosia artemisiifolia]
MVYIKQKDENNKQKKERIVHDSRGQNRIKSSGSRLLINTENELTISGLKLSIISAVIAIYALCPPPLQPPIDDAFVANPMLSLQQLVKESQLLPGNRK